jgi:hypothetical protein
MKDFLGRAPAAFAPEKLSGRGSAVDLWLNVITDPLDAGWERN